MRTYTLYTFGQHDFKPPFSSSPCPCDLYYTRHHACHHVDNPDTNRKPKFCPLALHAIKHFTSSSGPIRVCDPDGCLVQVGNKLWYTANQFDSFLSWYAGSIRPKQGTAEFGKSPMFPGPGQVSCDLFDCGLHVVGAGGSTGWGRPGLVLFSNGELRALRYSKEKEIDGHRGCFVLDHLKSEEKRALRDSGCDVDKKDVISIAQMGHDGPVHLLLRDGSVVRLSWRSMSWAGFHPGGKVDLPDKVVEMCARNGAVVVRTESEQVFYWQTIESVIRVRLPQQVRITSVKAGHQTCAAILENKELWVWRTSRKEVTAWDRAIDGFETDPKLEKDGTVAAEKLELPGGAAVTDVSIGPEKLAVRDMEGNWYTAGSGSYGELGIGERLFDIEGNAEVERGEEFVQGFEIMDVQDIDEGKVESVICGSCRTLIIATEEG